MDPGPGQGIGRLCRRVPELPEVALFRLSRPALVSALLLSVTLPVLPARAARPEPMACRVEGRVHTCDVALPAGVRVRSSTVQVVVPAGYETSERAYPVVFVLHGVGDSHASWTRSDRGDLTALTAACDAIFVMPDGGSGTQAGWYSDWKDGSYQYETFHTSVLPRAVDTAFRTKGSRHRAIAGLSMGGFGALSYAARHPGMFRAAASYSGFVDTTFGAPVTGAVFHEAGQSSVYSTGTPHRGVWGDQTADRATWDAHNPYALAERLRGTPLYLSSGHGAPGGSRGDDPSKAHNSVAEAYIGHVNDRLAERLTSLAIPFADGRELGGQHDWPYWRANFSRSLGVLMPALRTATKGCGA